MIEYTVRVWPSGSKSWWLNDQLHREDGPAVECWDDTKFWYGYKAWYLNGKKVTKEEHNRLTYKVIEMTMEEINKALCKKVNVIE